MKYLANHLLKLFLTRTLAKCCPATIPRSGDEGLKVDCFYVHQRRNGEPYLTFTSTDSISVSALEYDGEKYAIDRLLDINDLNPSLIQFTHYYRSASITYSGIWDLLIGQLFRFPYVQVWLHETLNGLAQWLFNRRPLVVLDRIGVLRDVVALAQQGKLPIDSMDILSCRHGDRWAGHPEWMKNSGYIDFLLEGLADTGELSRINGSYKPTGFAIKTIEEIDEQDRKHKSNIRIQFGIAILAFITMLATAAQANIIIFPTMLNLSK